MANGEQIQFVFPPIVTPQGDGSYVLRPGKPVHGPEYLTVQQVADKLQLDDSHVRDLIEEGEIHAVNIGTTVRKHWRVPRAELDRFVERRTRRSS